MKRRARRDSPPHRERTAASQSWPKNTIQPLRNASREGPQAHGFETNLWTLDRIAEIIEREFDISVSSSSVWRYLRKMGWSCQKPEQRARERDDEEIRRWMTETWPAIKKARTEGYTLVFVDECGFYLDPVVRRTWAPRGETPVQYSWTRQGRLSVFTALLVTLRDNEQPPDVGLFFWIREKHYTGWIIYELLRDDLRYRWQDSILVLDNWAGHKKAARLLEEAFDDTSLALDIEYLPPYAPELNPVEQVWGHTKYGELSNYVPEDIDTLEARVDQSIAAKDEQPELLQGFLKAAELDFGLK